MPVTKSLRTPEGNAVTWSPDLAVAELAAREWGVLSLEELRACGLSRKAVGVRVRRGDLHPPHPGVYAVGHSNLSPEGEFLAAVKACGPGTVLSHYAAAALHELVKWDGRTIEVTAPSRHRVKGITAHRSERIERTRLKVIPAT